MNQNLQKARNRVRGLSKVETTTNDPLLAEIHLAGVQALIGVGEELEKLNGAVEKLPYAVGTRISTLTFPYDQVERTIRDMVEREMRRRQVWAVGDAPPKKRRWWHFV